MNLLTFDVEDWYHINYPVIDFAAFDQQEDHQGLVDRTRKLIDCCQARGLKGTFFVLGRLLEKRPDLGEWIVGQGQELALHGYEHDLLTKQGPEQFKQELERSLEVFREITGNYPLGFRAPSWSINVSNLWVLEVLESFGFLYDSSIFPVKTFLYGLPVAPSEPFYPVIRGRKLNLLEVPVTVTRLGSQRIAYSGGIYFNLWPFTIIRKIAGQQARQGKNNLFYFHPWDLWKRSSHHHRQLKARWISFHLGDTLKKFEKLLDSFPLGCVSANLPALKERAKTDSLGTSHES